MSEAPESAYVIGKHTDKLLMGLIAAGVWWAGIQLNDLAVASGRLEEKVDGFEHRIGRNESRLDWLERSGRMGPERPAPR